MAVVRTRQNLLDVAVQEYGDVKASLELAVENGLSLTELLELPIDIALPAAQNRDRDILQFYKDNQLKPATGLTAQDILICIPSDSLFENGLFENGLFE